MVLAAMDPWIAELPVPSGSAVPGCCPASYSARGRPWFRWEYSRFVFPCAERTYWRSSEREAECHHGDLAAEGRQSETRSNDSKDLCEISFRRPFGRGWHSWRLTREHRRVGCEYPDRPDRQHRHSGLQIP